jgi:hypothetical protein
VIVRAVFPMLRKVIEILEIQCNVMLLSVF